MSSVSCTKGTKPTRVFCPFEISEKSGSSEYQFSKSYSGSGSTPRCSFHQTRQILAECPPELDRAANHRSQVSSKRYRFLCLRPRCFLRRNTFHVGLDKLERR